MTDYSKRPLTSLAKTYLTTTTRFNALLDQPDTETAVLETLDRKINDITEALVEKALRAGRTLRTEVNGTEFAITVDGQILIR